MKKKKKIDEDTTIVSPKQYNEMRNVPHSPDSEDGVRLKSPAVQGEESISGDMPDPDSDDDTLANAHAVGEQLDEDLEHPKPVDIARDIDKAEEAARES